MNPPARRRAEPRYHRRPVKLTEQDVRAIRALAGTYSYRMIADRFGVSANHVKDIVLRRYWKHVE